MPRHDYDGEKKQNQHLFEDSVECPECEGYGGWIIKRDASRPGRHFRALCTQCLSWGWVRRGSLNHICIHEWSHTANLGHCFDEWTCVKCGMKKNVDCGD